MINEEELIAQSANAPTMFFDGFAAYRKVNGVLRCIGFVCGQGAQLNLVISLAGAEEANRTTRRLLDGQPVNGLSAWEEGSATAH